MNKTVRILKARKKLHDIMEKKQKYKSISGTLWTTIALMALLWVFFSTGIWTMPASDPIRKAEAWRMVWPWLSLSTAIVVFAVVWTKLQRVK